MRALLLVALLQAGCETCAASLRSGLSVRVEDQRGEPICDAFVEARLGDQRWLIPDDDQCVYSWSDVGLYALIVRHAGYFSEPLAVRVGDDSCHELVERRVVRLRRLD